MIHIGYQAVLGFMHMMHNFAKHTSQRCEGSLALQVLAQCSPCFSPVTVLEPTLVVLVGHIVEWTWLQYRGGVYLSSTGFVVFGAQSLLLLCPERA